MVIRYFKCPVSGCGEKTAFDTLKIAKPNTNFVVCSKCKRKFFATVLPSCCHLQVLFVSTNRLFGQNIKSIQSFSKVA